MSEIVHRKLTDLFLDVHRFSAKAGLFLAIALAGVSIAGSCFVPTKVLSILLSAMGCFASGWFFASFLTKTMHLGFEERDADEALAAQREENAKLQSEVAELRAKNRRLEKQRIDINDVRPIIKLGLMEADMTVKDVKIEWMDDDFEKEGLIESIRHARRSQYVGVLQRSFKAVYGVDLAKLRIREDDDCLRVAGIAPESLGMKDDESKWLLRQVQRYRLKTTSKIAESAVPNADVSTGFFADDKYYEIDRKASFEGILDLNRTAEPSNAQEKELRERINNGIGEEFRNVNGYIREMAEGFVRILLAPVKKPVVFIATPMAEIDDSSSWLLLEAFAKDWNRRLAEPEP